MPFKAVWASDSRTVYLAAPEGGQGISDPNGTSLTTDSFYRLDVSTLEKTEFKPDNLNLDGRELFLNVSEDKLFFKNAQDGELYYLDLTQ